MPNAWHFRHLRHDRTPKAQNLIPFRRHFHRPGPHTCTRESLKYKTLRRIGVKENISSNNRCEEDRYRCWIGVDRRLVNVEAGDTSEWSDKKLT